MTRTRAKLRGKGGCKRPGCSRACIAFLAMAPFVWCAGCSGLGHATDTGDEIAALHLFSSPAALNLDDDPEADGFPIKVYAVSRGAVKGRTIEEGQLEIRLYDGLVSGTELETKTPLFVHSFGPTELAQRAVSTPIGTAYDVLVRWDENPPRTPEVTVTVRWIAPDGRVVGARPVALRLGTASHSQGTRSSS